MYISFFIEIDTNKEVKYKKEFLHMVEVYRSTGGHIIASKEYASLVKENAEDVVWEIPEEVMEDISANLENSWDREYLLVIQKNDKLEQWMLERLKGIEQQIEAIMCYREYISVGKVAQEIGVEAYCEYSTKNGEAQNSIQQLLSSMQSQMKASEEKEKSLQENVTGLQEYIASTENYLKELQKHATELDEELQHYKAFYDENSERVEQLQDENQKYISLYKENLEELNKMRVAYLDLKEQNGNHKKRKEK